MLAWIYGQPEKGKHISEANPVLPPVLIDFEPQAKKEISTAAGSIERKRVCGGIWFPFRRTEIMWDAYFLWYIETCIRMRRNGGRLKNKSERMEMTDFEKYSDY